jgi:sterol desaturase/sphingolipid hydroxylase (fatty acid hydroxylase superfamily)
METIINNLPGPIELLLDPISLVVFGIYAVLMTWEALFPARTLPKMKYWKLKGIAAFVLFFFLSSYLPILWDNHLSAYQLVELTSLGTAWGAFAGIMVYELGVYVWHRAMHRNNILWKIFHQMHHSAERVDSFGAFYFSPMDMIGFTFLGSICLVVITGFTAEATTLIILGTTFLSIFQHSNIKTPRWIGYIIQRPEAHAIHHAKGIHAYNYSDISLYDILFGTFWNPKGYDHETGFYHGASARIVEMLTFRDVSKEKESVEEGVKYPNHVM